MRKEVERKIFIEKLPMKYGVGSNKNVLIIDWEKSAGYKINFIYDNINSFIEIVSYNKKNSMVKIKYENEEFNIASGNLKKCKLGSILGKTTSRFKIEIGTIFKDDKRNITILNREYRVSYDKNNRKYNEKWYQYHCNKCKYKGWIIEGSLMRNYGCSACCRTPRSIILGINTIWDTDPWMIPIVGEEIAKTYIHGSIDNVKVKCLECGRIKNKRIYDIYKYHSIGCQCGDGFSYGHKYIYNLFVQLNQNFKDNYSFDWCKFYNIYKQKETTGEYDFVLEDNKLIIEVDGGFHRRDNMMNGQTKEESLWIDKEKDKLAEEQGYKVIRISDEGEFKDNIFKSDLVYLFNLDSIDWIKCEEFALSNRVREACDLWNTRKYHETTVNIANKMNLTNVTISKWLKKGNKLGWCIYNSKEELKKCGIRSGTKTGKQILMLKNGFFIGIFPSGHKLEEKSELLFNTKLFNSNICATCRGEKSKYKGYEFKYVQDLTSEEYLKYDIANKLKDLDISEEQIK